MTCQLLGFPLAATAQARREAARDCRSPLVDCDCAACGRRTAFAAWADGAALAAIACRHCGAVGRWRLAAAAERPARRPAGAAAPGAPGVPGRGGDPAPR